MKHFLAIPLIIVLCALLSACYENQKSSGETHVSEGTDTTSTTGIGGSTAKFVIHKNHLITVEDNDIQVFSLASPTQPELVNSYYTQSNLILETIYPYSDDVIMLGTNQGAIIMDHSTAGTLEQISIARHFTSCDPVIANGDYMYVTLRNGRSSSCSQVSNTQGVNQLLVFDISDITNPILEKTIELDQPYGLGIKGTSLFICYVDGIYKFDITNPTDPVQVGDYSQQCNDIIAATDPMILTGEDGIRLVQDNNLGLTELAIIRQGD